jgi:D-3-phosphoglycerate dehydrogenase
MGMSVLYYDVIPLMALGTSKQVDSLNTLLRRSDFVTLHVPETPDTQSMFGEAEFSQMKEGSYLINNSRGSIVDIPSLVNAMRSGKLAGAALDVYPNEPGGNGDYFNASLNAWADDLRKLKNLILTPHIGGSTEEAQSAIGIEVAQFLAGYINEGSTNGSVNLPEVRLRSLTIDEPSHARVIYIHKNVPGVLRRVNDILADHNIDKQMTDSRGEVAYLMADISGVDQGELKALNEKLEGFDACIRTRILY